MALGYGYGNKACQIHLGIYVFISPLPLPFFYLLPFPPISFSNSLDFRVLSVRIAIVAFISAFSNYFMPSWSFNTDPPDQPLF